MFKIFKWKSKNKLEEEFNYLERSLKLLNMSKYCKVNNQEEIFIRKLYERLDDEHLIGYIKLNRMSNKSIDFYYKTYPVGKFKLNGKKTWMQIPKSLYNNKVLTEEPFERYIEGIEDWIRYIKKQKL